MIHLVNCKCKVVRTWWSWTIKGHSRSYWKLIRRYRVTDTKSKTLNMHRKTYGITIRKLISERDYRLFISIWIVHHHEHPLVEHIPRKAHTRYHQVRKVMNVLEDLIFLAEDVCQSGKDNDLIGQSWTQDVVLEENGSSNGGFSFSTQFTNEACTWAGACRIQELMNSLVSLIHGCFTFLDRLCFWFFAPLPFSFRPEGMGGHEVFSAWRYALPCLDFHSIWYELAATFLPRQSSAFGTMISPSWSKEMFA